MWLGRPGNLVQLPALQPNVGVDDSRGQVIHASVSGSITAQNMYKDPKRVYSIPWAWLQDDELIELLAFKYGHYGPGPFVLLTEFDRNILDANQSSGTDQRGTTDGFSASLGTLLSVTGGYKGLRQLNWQLPASGSSPSLKLVWKGNLPGIPALPNQEYAFSVWLKANTATNIQLKLSYRTTANVEVGSMAWTAISVGTSWSRLDISGKSVDGTQHILPTINVTSGVSSQLISVDQAQLEYGNAASAWHPGLGVPYVSISDVPRKYVMQGYESPGTVKFTEVG